ncbi:hypothetical protein ACHAWO_007692 [Cyclotella atomus]|uniref:Mitochondrial splicing suppressor 51-like C-terminal domain-containing protein n=1 Tax=Cyclotella atomus TaxID=382360 RepID=A0ABD3PRX9_9STRA
MSEQMDHNINEQSHDDLDGHSQDEVSQEEDVSYMMEGYTPLNFNMNALALGDDSDSDDSQAAFGEMFAAGYYQLAPNENRRLNGVKTHAGEFTSQVDEDSHDNQESESDSEGIVPVDFEALAEQALRGLDEEHRVTLERCDPDDSSASIAAAGTNEREEDCCKETAAAAEEPDDRPVFEATFPPAEITADVSNEQVASGSLARRKFPAARMSDKSYAQNPTKQSKTINSNAVKEAMKAIRKTAPKLASALDERSSASSTAAAYQTASQASYDSMIKSTCQAIRGKNALSEEQKLSSHPIIPSGPLAAFRRNTPKARSAAHNMSRSATLSEAVYRLWPLICFRKKLSVLSESVWSSTEQQQRTQGTRNLTIHIIGADGVECSSEDSVRNSVGAFVRWLDAALKCGALSESLFTATRNNNAGIALTIEFSGPNMPTTMAGKTMNLLSQMQCNYAQRGLAAAICEFHRCEYHDSPKTADLTVAFNAGIWGYDSWKPTLLSMIGKTNETASGNRSGALFVITAYTCEECEDDEEVISNLIKDHVAANYHQLWEAESNLFASRVERITDSASAGRQYFENGAWQAWLFG